MNFKRVLGIIILIIGLVGLGFSYYITQQVNEGKIQVESAQSSVDKGNSLLSLNRVSKEVGQKVLTDPAQKKINEGQMTIAQYEKMASWLQIGGIIFIVLGLALIIFGRNRKR
jgi:hypothetical protein